eukprot:scaffold12202_cov61-Phaeocystis_antarctica.AAC.1
MRIRARCPDACITPTRVGCPASLLRPACDGRARCRDACHITPTHVECAARLLRPAYDDRARCV